MNEVLVVVPLLNGEPFLRSTYASGLDDEKLSYSIVDATTPIPEVNKLLRSSHGVLFVGGSDINAASYGQTPHPKAETYDDDRDTLERLVMQYVWDNEIPFVGICRGAQQFAIQGGATLIQHIPDHIPPSQELHAKEHDKTYDDLYEKTYQHDVVVQLTDEPSLASQIFDLDAENNVIPLIPSMHHQAVDAESLQDTELIATGLSPHGIVEIIERRPKDKRQVPQIGFQGHIEAQAAYRFLVFSWFAAEVRKFAPQMAWAA